MLPIELFQYAGISEILETYFRVVTETELRKLLAENIRRRIALKNWSVVQLADFADVGKSQVYEVLGCKRAATTDWLCRVAQALEVEPWVLLAPNDSYG